MISQTATFDLIINLTTVKRWPHKPGIVVAARLRGVRMKVRQAKLARSAGASPAG
jgi:hypothetical protein